nr:hypothetical protein [Nocardia sp. AG03]
MCRARRGLRPIRGVRAWTRLRCRPVVESGGAGWKLPRPSQWGQSWLESGGERGPLGYRSTDEIVAPDGTGRFSRFERGMIYWSPSTGAHAVSGRILTLWSAAGYEASHYGYPTIDATAGCRLPAAVSQLSASRCRGCRRPRCGAVAANVNR